jgi:glutamyl-tRNA(Gln) amidotransferase subunit E
MKEITDLLSETNSHVIREVLDSGGVVLGIKDEGFAEVLVEDRKLTDSLAKKVETEAGVKGFISTDELPKYGLNKQDKRNIEEAFGVKEGDVVILVADQKEKAEKAIQIIEKEIAKRKE